MSAVLFEGGRIVTFDAMLGEPEVLVVDGGRVAAAGGRDLGRAWPQAKRIDLRGRTVAPGFIDAHNHLSIAALHPLWVDVSAATDAGELRRLLSEQAERESQARWIRACLWDESRHGLILDRHVLDEMGFDRPVIVAHYTLHQCAVSSLGLDELEIGATTPDPPGGVVVRGEDGGPNGLLVERAWSEAHARSLAAYRDPERWADLFEARMWQLIRDGITAVHDAACSPAAEEVYGSLHRARRMRLSVLAMPHAAGILSRLERPRLDGPPTGEGDELFRIGPIKLFADGGAAPAIQLTVGGHRGEAFGIEFPGLEEDVRAVVERGFRVAIHALGNLGVAGALRALRSASRRRDGDHRFRIEHACLASRDQLGEMAALGCVGVVQPGFVDHVGRMVEGLTSEEEIWLAFGEMQRAGIPLAASSDDPCAFHQPLRTSVHGATRRTGSGSVLGPEQALGYEEWLRLYSAGAAYAGGQEGERGTLTPGKRADLVLLDGALDAEHPPRVAETWVGGVRVFDANS